MRIKHFNLSPGVEIFKALSDEARIRILNLIFHKQEMCVSDLELVLDFTQTKTSRHLLYLRNAGLVGTRRTDQFVFYFIKDELKDVIAPLLRYMEKDALLLADIETFEILYGNKELSVSRFHQRRFEH
ncbi:MAG: ArsR family transcriptional regulator [Cytophagales bacterium]|nr:MAG: ArsR family transcriptional regulator [Cytophagales bacterium]TAF61020.1 MAG: ArsR family transcriptional regulator [Cytophagales bacterium]